MEVVGFTNSIHRVVVIDDEPTVRESYADTIKDGGMVPVARNDPLPSLGNFISELRSLGDAAVCDHHITVNTYADFKGSDLVAACNQSGFPAILCTTWHKAIIDEVRVSRRYIPVLVSELDVEDIRPNFEKCIREINNDFDQERRPWLTQVRVVEVEGLGSIPTNIFVVVPGWNSDEKIKIAAQTLPPFVLNNCKTDARFKAEVNIGAENQDDLYFSSWRTF